MNFFFLGEGPHLSDFQCSDFFLDFPQIINGLALIKQKITNKLMNKWMLPTDVTPINQIFAASAQTPHKHMRVSTHTKIREPLWLQKGSHLVVINPRTTLWGLCIPRNIFKGICNTGDCLGPEWLFDCFWALSCFK